MNTLGTGAAQLNLALQIGSAKDITFAFTNSDGPDTDISLWTFELFFKRFAGDRQKTFSLTLGSGLSFPVYEDNELLAEISTSNSSVEEGEYFWELRRTDEDTPIVNGLAYFSFEGDTGDLSVIDVTSGSQTISLSGYGIISQATQAQVNAGTATGVYVDPKKLANKDADVVALTSGASIALTNEKHSLATALTAITFTQSFIGDVQVIEITLTGTALTLTFPSGYLCQSQGTASGDNTCALSGTSGDKYVICVIKIGSNYYVSANNLGQ